MNISRVSIAFLAAVFASDGLAQSEIMLPRKTFVDIGDMVMIAGTLTGANLAYPNNTTTIQCYLPEKSCSVGSVEQIGSNMMGRIDFRLGFRVKRATTEEVLLDNDAPDLSCTLTTITILRRQQSAVWVETPIWKDTPHCPHSSKQVRTFTIENSPGVIRLEEAVKAQRRP